MAVTTTSASEAVAAVVGCGFICSASAAQIASTRWKKGSQRKLHRKSPAVGIIESRSTIKSKISSHFIRRTSIRPCQTNPAMSAAGAAKPHASAVAACVRFREEKSVQFTVHDGRINPGSAAGGTSHCQWADAGCNSRAEPCTKSRIASHAGADNPKPSATPKSIGKIEKTFRVSTKDLADNHAVRSSNIKTVYGKPPVTRRYTNGAGQRNLHFVLRRSNARSAPHHAQGSQVNAPSAPNQSVAPQQMIQPFSEATSATKIDNGIENRRSRASKNVPIARTNRCVMERAAACCGNVSGNFQMRTTAAFTKTENVPY